jgi:hypothetical protein
MIIERVWRAGDVKRKGWYDVKLFGRRRRMGKEKESRNSDSEKDD